MKYLITKYLLLVTGITILTSCQKNADDLERRDLTPSVTDNFTLTLLNDSVTSDGISTACFVLNTDTIISKYNKAVVFTLNTIGKFANSATTYSTNLDANGEASVFVTSTTSGILSLKADITNVGSKTSLAHFVTAYPEQILIQPSIANMTSSFTSSTTITAQFLRTNGVPSSGLSVTFYDSTASNTSIGTFLNITASNNSGQCTAVYAIQDTSYHGFVYIKGYTNTNTGKKLGSNKILIQ